MGLKELENKSIYIIREAYAEFEKPAVLWSMGKDSTTALALCRKAFFGKIPFPVIHIDTGYKFKQMYEFRGRIADEWGLDLVIAKNEDAMKAGIVPEKGKLECCLPEGEKVITKEGVKEIQDVEIGEDVFSHRGRLKPVTDTFIHPFDGHLIKIEPVYFRPFLVTPNHPILAMKTRRCIYSSRNKICKETCAETTKGGKCKEFGEYYRNYNSGWIPADDLREGDFLVYPAKFEERKVGKIDLARYVSNNFKVTENYLYTFNYPKGNKIPRFVEINNAFLRLLGYYVAEGWHSNGIFFSISEKEINLAKDIKRKLCDVFGLNPSKDIIREGSRRIGASSVILGDVFGNWFGDKASNKKIPSWLFQQPVEEALESSIHKAPIRRFSLLGGMFAGDGYVNSKNISYSTTSIHLAEQLKLMLLRIGIIPSVSEVVMRESEIDGRKIISENKMYNVITSGKDDLRKFRSVIQRLPKSKTKMERARGYIKDGYAFIPIKSFSKVPYNGMVFNLEVEEDNSYLLRGGAVHNCTSLKTKALMKTLEEYGFDALLLAIRRDEHGIRAKERVFSPRDKEFMWNYRDQPLEMWDQYQSQSQAETAHIHTRVHPILHWRELDVWEYIKQEKDIPVNPMYFASDGKRYRSLGCEPCTSPIDSDAKTIDEIVEELRTTKIAERSGRAQDKEKTFMMQKLRALGYM